MPLCKDHERLSTEAGILDSLPDGKGKGTDFHESQILEAISNEPLLYNTIKNVIRAGNNLSMAIPIDLSIAARIFLLINKY